MRESRRTKEVERLERLKCLVRGHRFQTVMRLSGCGTIAMTQYENLTVCGCVGDLRLNVIDKDLTPSLSRKRIHQSLDYQTPMTYESVKLSPN